jgi:hypothetical protein
MGTRLAEALSTAPMEFVERPMSAPLNFDAADPYAMSEMDLSLGSLTMPDGFGAPSSSPPHESLSAAAAPEWARSMLSSETERAAGPGALKAVYCWFRGAPAGMSEYEGLARTFLTEHTDASVDPAGAEVQVIYGGSREFAMRPRDGLTFDFSFRVPGGIGEDDTILEGSDGERDFALLLRFG